MGYMQKTHSKWIDQFVIGKDYLLIITAFWKCTTLHFSCGQVMQRLKFLPFKLGHKCVSAKQIRKVRSSVPVHCQLEWITCLCWLPKVLTMALPTRWIYTCRTVSGMYIKPSWSGLHDWIAMCFQRAWACGLFTIG